LHRKENHMSTGAIIGIVVAAVVIIALVAVVVTRRNKSSHLREKFGPEYDREVADRPRREAERELAEREKEHAKLDIKALDPQARERYTAEWKSVQEQFVDRPVPAVQEADRLVTALMAERGYPTEGSHEDRVRHLSVEHASTLDHYRAAHEVRGKDDASTEQLREAMVHYRDLFTDLLGYSGHAGEAAEPGATGENWHRGTDGHVVEDDLPHRPVAKH
jgi:FtsZ-interacting cell division protein ZipA